MCLYSPSEQVNAYPWIAALLREEDTTDGYINSKCSAVLVGTSPFTNQNLKIGQINEFYKMLFSPDRQQICLNSGPLPLWHWRQRWEQEDQQLWVAACQCLLHHAWPPWQEQYRGAKQVSTDIIQIFIGPFHTRKQIKVTKIVVHENFNNSMNDIALLRLGETSPGVQLLTL